ncbi:MAG TPA: nitrilase-related carbon-nitrogen hydrolase, partial [Candidatus Binatia bacterium]|nr:nitrilase-related carbon-nitrogen hydrolase [Candidatus Binatia bacterium]
MTRIALAQITSSTEKTANLKLAKELIGEAKSKGARLIAFPEFLMAFSPASQPPEELTGLAEPLAGSFATTLGEAARIHDIHLLATIYEQSNVPNRVYDTALWIDNVG